MSVPGTTQACSKARIESTLFVQQKQSLGAEKPKGLTWILAGRKQPEGKGTGGKWEGGGQ